MNTVPDRVRDQGRWPSIGRQGSLYMSAIPSTERTRRCRVIHHWSSELNRGEYMVRHSMCTRSWNLEFGDYCLTTRLNRAPRRYELWTRRSYRIFRITEWTPSRDWLHQGNSASNTSAMIVVKSVAPGNKSNMLQP